ncbi:TPR repeat protein [Pseudomonas oryzihabitans]
MQCLFGPSAACRFICAVQSLIISSGMSLCLTPLALGLALFNPLVLASDWPATRNSARPNYQVLCDDGALEAARFRDQACRGDAIAAVSLARMYLSGNGWFAEDVGRGKSFLMVAIRAGNYQAAADLAVVILKESQDEQALKEAARWAKVALFDRPTPEALMAASLVKMVGREKDLTASYQDGVRWYLLNKGKNDGYIDPAVCGIK